MASAKEHSQEIKVFICLAFLYVRKAKKMSLFAIFILINYIQSQYHKFGRLQISFPYLSIVLSTNERLCA